MTPVEAIDFLLEMYGKSRLPLAMKRMYEAPLQGLDGESVARVVATICENYVPPRIPTVRQVRDMADLYRPRKHGPARVLSPHEQWLREDVLPPHRKAGYVRACTALVTKIVTERWSPEKRLEAFKAMDAKYPNCNWPEAIRDTEALMAARKGAA